MAGETCPQKRGECFFNGLESVHAMMIDGCPAAAMLEIPVSG
jgi:hypothetical protein